MLLEFHIDISLVAGFPFFKSATNCWCDIAKLCDAAILYLSKTCDVPLPETNKSRLKNGRVGNQILPLLVLPVVTLLGVWKRHLFRGEKWPPFGLSKGHGWKKLALCFQSVPFSEAIRRLRVWNFLPGLTVHDLEKGSAAFQRDVVSKEGSGGMVLGFRVYCTKWVIASHDRADRGYNPSYPLVKAIYRG